MVIYTVVMVSGYIFLFKYMSSGTKENENERAENNK